DVSRRSRRAVVARVGPPLVMRAGVASPGSTRGSRVRFGIRLGLGLRFAGEGFFGALEELALEVGGEASLEEARVDAPAVGVGGVAGDAEARIGRDVRAAEDRLLDRAADARGVDVGRGRELDLDLVPATRGHADVRPDELAV